MVLLEKRIYYLCYDISLVYYDRFVQKRINSNLKKNVLNKRFIEYVEKINIQNSFVSSVFQCCCFFSNFVWCSFVTIVDGRPILEKTKKF